MQSYRVQEGPVEAVLSGGGPLDPQVRGQLCEGPSPLSIPEGELSAAGQHPGTLKVPGLLCTCGSVETHHHISQDQSMWDLRDCPHIPLPACGSRWQDPQNSRSCEGPTMQASGPGCLEGESQL